MSGLLIRISNAEETRIRYVTMRNVLNMKIHARGALAQGVLSVNFLGWFETTVPFYSNHRSDTRNTRVRSLIHLH